MTFPVIAATNTSETASSGTSHVVALPASISAGQLLVIAISFNATVTATLPATWTAELVDNGDANQTGLWCAYKFASGSEGASVTVTSSGSAQSTHASARFTGMHASAAPEAGTVAIVGNSATHDPTGITPSWGSADTMFMALFAWRNSARTVSTYPTSYTDNQTTKNNSAGGNSTGIAFATRNLTGTTDNPGAMTLSAASVGQCITLAIRPDTVGAAAFTGTATLTFAQTGALAGTAVHAGTSAISFAQTGALKGGATAAGTTTLVFAQTGAFAATAKFGSTTTIVFSQTGAFSSVRVGTGITFTIASDPTFTVQTAPFEILVDETTTGLTSTRGTITVQTAAPIITVRPDDSITVQSTPGVTVH